MIALEFVAYSRSIKNTPPLALQSLLSPKQLCVTGEIKLAVS
jgi:hypothetical protein